MKSAEAIIKIKPERANLTSDLMAGLTFALVNIPQSMAHALLAAVNPVLGLGAFLAQFVLKDPLSKAFALQYDVTGSWTDPKIARRQRITPSQTTEAVK